MAHPHSFDMRAELLVVWINGRPHSNTLQCLALPIAQFRSTVESLQNLIERYFLTQQTRAKTIWERFRAVWKLSCFAIAAFFPHLHSGWKRRQFQQEESFAATLRRSYIDFTLKGIFNDSNNMQEWSLKFFVFFAILSPNCVNYTANREFKVSKSLCYVFTATCGPVGPSMALCDLLWSCMALHCLENMVFYGIVWPF